MFMNSILRLRSTLAVCFAVSLVIGLLSPAPARGADDRDLFSASTEAPYLFVLFDTSGSMHWSPQCTDPGGCRYICPLDDASCEKVCPIHVCIDDNGTPIEKAVCDADETEAWMCDVGDCPNGDCYQSMNADDPGSKFFQAKNALYEVIQRSVDREIPLQMGFATFNQDQLRAIGKHWLYRLNEGQTPLSFGSGLTFPRAEAEQVFGRTFNCTAGPDTGFNAFTPANLGQEWEHERLYRCPQLGQNGTSDASGSRLIYIRDPVSGTVYRLRWRDVSGQTIGSDQFTALLQLHRCDSGDCGTRTFIGQQNFTYTLVSDFAMWDVNSNAQAFPATLNQRFLAYFSQGTASDGPAGNTCNGWDPNTDDANDLFDGYSLRFPNSSVDPRGGEFRSGDVVPWDWLDDHRDDVQQRLAPNLAAGGLPDSPPDFRVGRYLDDALTGTTLRLRNANERPITAFGGTPLGASIQNFRTWYGAWEPTASAEGTGDPTYDCRPRFLLVLTDGDETCGGDPCNETDLLYGADASEPEVETFVVAFGVQNQPGNQLNCMPRFLPGDGPFDDPNGLCVDDVTGLPLFDAQGRCQKAFFAANREELINILTSVLREITGSARAFATAAVPSVQADVSDKVFFATFVPTRGVTYDDGTGTMRSRAWWSGSINTFLKPVPLDSDGRPDTTDSAFLYDVGQEMLTQINATDPLGPALSQRRVYYSLFNGSDDRPATRRLFDPTDPTMPYAVRQDLWRGFGIPFVPGFVGPGAGSELDAEAEANRVLTGTLALKTYLDPLTGAENFILGDTFHSNPVLVDTPPNTQYFSFDVEGNGVACEDNPDGSPKNPSYRCFTLKHENRRKVLISGTNDGMLHGFDAGSLEISGLDAGEFDDGSGKELFAYIPREILPDHLEMNQPDAPHRFTVDGTFAVGDHFIDPVHDGVAGSDPPDADERQWRTVGVGTLRKGGRGLYALDITQPDRLDNDDLDGDGFEEWVPATSSTLPTCWGGEDGTSLPADCGPLPYPAPLWEFTDSIVGLAPFVRHDLDEEPTGTCPTWLANCTGGNPLTLAVGVRSEPLIGRSTYDAFGGLTEAKADLGQTWSQPVFGRIRICGDATGECNPDEPDTDVEDRYVAVFGGGFDPEEEEERGNWIYIVDVETGLTLYKKPLLGTIPATVEAIDTNFDAYIDRLYFGTTRGFVYRVDLTADGSGDYPAIKTVSVTDIDDVSHSVDRIDEDYWNPEIIFDANEVGADTLVRPRAIYTRVTAVFVAKDNEFAIAFGTGNRDDLWRTFDMASGGPQRGRFYMIEDVTQDLAAADLPLLESDLTRINPNTDPDLGSTSLLTPNSGWYFDLNPDERLVADPFAVTGVVVFNTYTPDPSSTTITDDEDNALCQRTGVSRVFGVFAANGDGLLTLSAGGSPERFQQVDDFVTAPYTELGQSKNTGSGAANTSDDLTPALEEILDRLKDFLPSYCRFGNYRMDIKALQSDTGNVFIAPVPICLVEKNWREL